MKVELSKEKFLILKDFFEKYIPDVEISSVIMDESLYNLGISKHISCIVEFEITEKQVEKVYDILYDMETYAVLSSEEEPSWYDPLLDNGHPKKTKEEEMYEEYGWIESLFYDFDEENQNVYETH